MMLMRAFTQFAGERPLSHQLLQAEVFELTISEFVRARGT